MSTAKTITVTREELYQQVWSTPMRKLAANYGLSDVGLAKVCKKHLIPRPPVGYWAKKEFGQDPPQEPLPRCDDPILRTIEFRFDDSGKADVAPPDEPKLDQDVLDLMRTIEKAAPVTVSDSLRQPHPLVHNTRLALENGYTDHHNLVHPGRLDRADYLSLSVAKPSIGRALRFFDALLKAVERFGGKVSIKKDQWKQKCVVTFLGEDVADIRLRERYKQVPRKDPPKDRYFEPRCDYVPTGMFVLESNNSYWQRVWGQDTPKRPLEDSINGILLKWAEKSGRMRIDRRAAEEARKKREEEERVRREREPELQRKRQELEAKQKVEQSRVNGLLAEADSWERSRALRAYIDAVERYLIGRNGSITEGTDGWRWLQWAREQADRLDPLAPTPHSVLDEKVD